jgi:serine/threonine-protein kinase RsbW
MSTADPDNEATFHVCVINSDQRETDIPKRAILDELRLHRFSEEAQFGVKLALEEALTNAVKHGNLCDATKQITVKYAVNDEKAAIIVRDEGGGFIPEKVPDPTTPDRLPHPNGRGIMLMRAYMDEVVFRDKGREVYFIKRRA